MTSSSSFFSHHPSSYDPPRKCNPRNEAGGRRRRRRTKRHFYSSQLPFSFLRRFLRRMWFKLRRLRRKRELLFFFNSRDFLYSNGSFTHQREQKVQQPRWTEERPSFIKEVECHSLRNLLIRCSFLSLSLSPDSRTTTTTLT